MHGEYGAPRGCCTLAMFTLFLDGSSKPSLGVQPDSLSFQSPEFMKSTPLHKPSSPSLISCFPPYPVLSTDLTMLESQGISEVISSVKLQGSPEVKKLPKSQNKRQSSMVARHSTVFSPGASCGLPGAG